MCEAARDTKSARVRPEKRRLEAKCGDGCRSGFPSTSQPVPPPRANPHFLDLAELSGSGPLGLAWRSVLVAFLEPLDLPHRVTLVLQLEVGVEGLIECRDG